MQIGVGIGLPIFISISVISGRHFFNIGYRYRSGKNQQSEQFEITIVDAVLNVQNTKPNKICTNIDLLNNRMNLY